MKFNSLGLSVALGLLMVLCFGRIHIRSETLRFGYELGRLKTKEAQLLEQKSSLQMELSKISTRKALEALIREKSLVNGVALSGTPLPVHP